MFFFNIIGNLLPTNLTGIHPDFSPWIEELNGLHMGDGDG